MIQNGIILSVKSSWIAQCFIMVIAYFTDIREIVHVMLIFLAIDTISGIWASLKEKQKFESNRLRRTIYKFLWYTVAVMLAWMMEKTFSLGWANLASITGGFICFVELKSIFENITRITDEPIFMKILKIFKRKGTETIQEIDEDDEPKTQSNGKS
jgi:phage-related holin